jgi:RNA polymerase sigma factor (sigma-70 family)
MAQRLDELAIPTEGDPSRAWAPLYSAIRPLVYSELFRILPYPYEDLEDLWHDLFIRFVRDPSILASVVPQSRETYVRVATRRRALNYVRDRRRRDAAVARLPVVSVSDSVPASDARVDFKELLSRIDERDRQLVMWRFVDDLSIAAIARRVGVSYSAAAVRIFRALGKARKSLGESGDVKG